MTPPAGDVAKRANELFARFALHQKLDATNRDLLWATTYAAWREMAREQLEEAERSHIPKPGDNVRIVAVGRVVTQEYKAEHGAVKMTFDVLLSSGGECRNVRLDDIERV